MHRRKKVDDVTPAGTSNELDVQNEWEENTHTWYCTVLYYYTLTNYSAGADSRVFCFCVISLHGD